MIRKLVSKVQEVSFSGHLLINLLIRIVLIKYGDFMDARSEVPYTDIDYRVITDGAMHVQNNSSPYLRHTYRYSPLLAIMVLPNLTLNKNFGKILFACCDILIGILVKAIICNEFKRTFLVNSQAVIRRINNKDGNKKKILQDHILEDAITDKLSRKYESVGEVGAYFWLYNPLTMVIGTRGNGDAISSALVLLSLYFLQLPKQRYTDIFIAGLFHGIAIHLRLYPIFFSLAFYLVLAKHNQAASSRLMSTIKSILRPNGRQFTLVLGTVLSLFSVTAYFYHKYGYEFLYETYIYHLERKDTRHNFSLFFYMQYLTSADAAALTGLPLLDKFLIGAPSLAIILVLTFNLGTHFKTLPFCLFAQAFVMVSYNSVVTSQYFIWFLSLLPLCLKNLKRVGKRSAVAYVVLWFLAQGGWLLPAYFLEFKGWNTFDLIWIQSLMLFSSNVFILQRLITNFDVLCDFNAFFTTAEVKKKL